MAALAGLPQVGVLHHLEQVFHARRAEAAGILRIVPRGGEGIADAIAQAHADAGLRDAARGFAAALRREYPGDPLAILAARLAPEVAAAVRA